MNDVPKLGKFEGNPSASLSQYLYDLSMEGWVEENFGFVDEAGWYGIIHNIDVPNAQAYIHQEYGTEPDINQHYILSEDTQGFFTYEGFDDLDEVNRRWKDITDGLK